MLASLRQRGEFFEGFCTEGCGLVALELTACPVVVPTELAEELAAGATEGLGWTVPFHTAAAALDAGGGFHGNTVAGNLFLEGKVQALGKGRHAPFSNGDTPLTCGARDGTPWSLG